MFDRGSRADAALRRGGCDVSSVRVSSSMNSGTPSVLATIASRSSPGIRFRLRICRTMAAEWRRSSRSRLSAVTCGRPAQE
jgi:hypothetical protein